MIFLDQKCMEHIITCVKRLTAREISSSECGRCTLSYQGKSRYSFHCQCVSVTYQDFDINLTPKTLDFIRKNEILQTRLWNMFL